MEKHENIPAISEGEKNINELQRVDLDIQEAKRTLRESPNIGLDFELGLRDKFLYRDELREEVKKHERKAIEKWSGEDKKLFRLAEIDFKLVKENFDKLVQAYSETKGIKLSFSNYFIAELFPYSLGYNQYIFSENINFDVNVIEQIAASVDRHNFSWERDNLVRLIKEEKYPEELLRQALKLSLLYQDLWGSTNSLRNVACLKAGFKPYDFGIGY